MDKSTIIDIPKDLKERLQSNLKFCGDQLDNPTVENLTEWFNLDDIKIDYKKIEALIPDEAWEL